MRSVFLIGVHAGQSGTVAALRVDATESHLRRGGYSLTVGRRVPSENLGDLVVRDPVWSWRQRGAGAGGYFRRLTRRMLSAMAFRTVPDEQAFWSICIARQARRRFSDAPPDAVIVSGPPFSSFLAAAWLARRWRRPLILDYRDLWTLGGYFDRKGLRASVERQLERVVWKYATGATTVSEPLARELKAHAGHLDVRVVRNGYDRRVLDVLNRSILPRTFDLPIQVTYVGEIYPGRRDPRPLFEALAANPDLRRDVRVTFRGASAETLLPMVSELGLQETVDLGPRVSLVESLRLQARSDVLLLLLWNDSREEGVYSGKLFEYLASRRRILMLGYREGVAARLIMDRGAGVVANDPSEIAVALRQFVCQKVSGDCVNDPDVAAGLDRESQLAHLDSLLAKLLGG